MKPFDTDRPAIGGVQLGYEHPMRTPCRRCNSTSGLLRTVNGQDTVRCAECHLFAYNAPRTETGREARRVTDRPKLSPSVIARTRLRFGNQCAYCDTPETTENLHVSHLISVVDGRDYGIPDEIIKSDANLMLLCDAHNLTMGRTSASIQLILHAWRLEAILAAREQHQDKPRTEELDA